MRTCSISWREDLLERSFKSIRSRSAARSVADCHFSRFETEVQENRGCRRSYSQAYTASCGGSPLQPIIAADNLYKEIEPEFGND